MSDSSLLSINNDASARDNSPPTAEQLQAQNTNLQEENDALRYHNGLLQQRIVDAQNQIVAYHQANQDLEAQVGLLHNGVQMNHHYQQDLAYREAAVTRMEVDLELRQAAMLARENAHEQEQQQRYEADDEGSPPRKRARLTRESLDQQGVELGGPFRSADRIEE